jgi:glucokinase
MTDFVLGFDVGGTRLKAGAVDRRGRLLAESIAPSGADRGPEALVRRLAEESARLARRAGGRPLGIGIGLPGAIRPDRGVVLLPGRLAGLEGFPLVPRLAKRTGLPVRADNDARLALLAESRWGAARGRKWALSITIGTGLGSGVLLDGRVLRDPHLQFGTQASHMVIDLDGRLCFTGARGTAEMLCSATALVSQVRDGLARGIPSILDRRDPGSIDFEAVAAACRRGDRLCRDELRVWTHRLGCFLVSAIHAYAPQVVVVGGGGAHAADLFLKSVRAYVREHLFRWPKGSTVPIVVSRLRDHAGVLGAAALAWEDAR